MFMPKINGTNVIGLIHKVKDGFATNNISLRLVLIKLSINRLVANLIIQAQLIKVGLTNVLTKLGVHGQQLLTTARQILQRVKALLQRGR